MQGKDIQSLEKKEATNLEQANELQQTQEQLKEGENRKDPQTLSEGQRMGLSKQQLRKLQKRIAKNKKDNQKKLKQKQEAEKKQKEAKETQKRNRQKQQLQISQEQLKEFRNQKIVLQPNRRLPEEGSENILVTSALPYVNNIPHLGNIIGCVLSADVYSRFKKLQGSNTVYICGTDQYGTATEVKAMEEKKTPKEICDYYFKIHDEVYKWFDIGFDYFGRTSTEWHTKITQQIFLHIEKNGKITKEEMTQCYCENCSLFLADRFISGICPHPQCKHEQARGDQCDKCGKLFNSPTQLINYVCNLCKKPPVIKSTTHFFINLPLIQEELQSWVEKASKQGQWSENSITITNGWLKMGLKPKCITRDLKWGVPVPIQGYENKVFYVWFDAPIGYQSITANFIGEDYVKWWQNNKDVKLYQFMGKDNVPFHTVVFPSSLIASQQGWTLLHHISTTEYLNYEKGKFSKTHGTGVFGNNAIELADDISSEVWRYYLLVNRPEVSDSEFSWKDFADKNNNELLANVGNLVNRVLLFIYNNYQQKIPVIDKMKLDDEIDMDFINELQSRYQKYRDLLNKVEIKQGLKFCMEISSRGNKYLQQSKFWEEQNRKSGRTAIVLNVVTNFIRFVSFVLEPYIPSTSAKINYLLGLEDRTEHDATLGKQFNNKENLFLSTFLQLTSKSKGVRKPIPLFQAITEQKIKQWKQRFGGKQEVKENNA